MPQYGTVLYWAEVLYKQQLSSKHHDGRSKGMAMGLACSTRKLSHKYVQKFGGIGPSGGNCSSLDKVQTPERMNPYNGDDATARGLLRSPSIQQCSETPARNGRYSNVGILEKYVRQTDKMNNEGSCHVRNRD